jgi:hypothetical protein
MFQHSTGCFLQEESSIIGGEYIAGNHTVYFALLNFRDIVKIVKVVEFFPKILVGFKQFEVQFNDLFIGKIGIVIFGILGLGLGLVGKFGFGIHIMIVCI